MREKFTYHVLRITKNMAVQLENVVPWGRSFAEYRAMFALSDVDLQKQVLGCGDDPASFNAEMMALGYSVLRVA